MGSDLNSNNLLQQLQNNVMNDEWLQQMYGTSRANQQQELKKLFTMVSENNLSDSEISALEARRDILADKVERLEAKMAVLEEQLTENQEKINTKTEELTNLISTIDTKSKQLETSQASYVKRAVNDVFALYPDNIEKDAISGEIRKRIKNYTGGNSKVKAINALLDNLDDKKNEIDSFVGDITSLIDQNNILSAQYGVTKSAYELINNNISVLAKSSNYTNSDYDTKVPVYSIEKTDIVSDYFENPKINVQSTNTNYNDEAGQNGTSLDTIKEKYAQYLGVAQTSGISAYNVNTTNNATVNALNNAINAGLLDDLKASNISGKEAADFFAQNFSGAGIKYNNDGELSIPYGHDKAAKEIYSKVSNCITEINNSPSMQGQLNTWDKNQGNTIDSNAQIKSLSESYEDILTKMGTQEPEFTFKEAMYALFDKESGLFKNSGINYDIDNPLEYSIDLAGDEETAVMYQGLSDKIYEIWGVNATNGSKENIGVKEEEPAEIKRTDPVSFMKDGTEYTFALDRNNDNTFNGINEFVGASDKTWIEDLTSLDANNDGKLSGDELKSLKIIGTTFSDNASTVSDGNFLRGETTKLAYSFTNADSIGIEEINLSALISGESDKTDINGSQIYSNDKFSFTLNGQEYTASRKDDTEDYLNSVYGNATNAKYSLGAVSESEAESVINENYAEYDTFNNKYSGIISKLNILNNAGAFVDEAHKTFKDTQNRIKENENIELVKAGNKAAALTQGTNWTSIEGEVAQICSNKGVTYNEDAQTQMKGIYVLDNQLSPEDIVNKYVEQKEKDNETKAAKENSSKAWQALSECLKAGVRPNASRIKELLKAGKSVNEIVDILKEEQGDTSVSSSSATTVKYNQEREDAIYNAFTEAFEGAGLNQEKIVDALADLCTEEQNNPGFMEDKTAEELAQYFLAKYV